MGRDFPLDRAGTEAALQHQRDLLGDFLQASGRAILDFDA
jgi:hypothetical protein